MEDLSKDNKEDKQQLPDYISTAIIEDEVSYQEDSEILKPDTKEKSQIFPSWSIPMEKKGTK